MVDISSDDSEEDFDVETVRKELSGSDPSDRAMRIRSKAVKYVVSDEEDFEMESPRSGSDSGEEFGIPPPKKVAVPTTKPVSKPSAKPPKVMTKPAPKRAPKSSKATSKVHYKKVLFTIITIIQWNPA